MKKSRQTSQLTWSLDMSLVSLSLGLFTYKTGRKRSNNSNWYWCDRMPDSTCNWRWYSIGTVFLLDKSKALPVAHSFEKKCFSGGLLREDSIMNATISPFLYGAHRLVTEIPTEMWASWTRNQPPSNPPQKLGPSLVSPCTQNSPHWQLVFKNNC